MTSRRNNTVLGCLLLVLSGVWIWLVVDTIPAGFGDGDIGARAFPLMFGICLAGLSVLLLIQAFRRKQGQAVPTGQETDPHQKIHWAQAGLLLVEISVYGYLLQTLGFVISTPIVVIFVMVVNLRIRSPKMLIALPIGITAISWVVFEKILGIYLANGSLINLG